MTDLLFPTPTFECDNGCYVKMARPHYDEVSGTYECPRCEGRCRQTGEEESEWVSIAIYDVHREYGGPEEGGWWYDVGVRDDRSVRSFQEPEFDKAKAYMKELIETYRADPNASVRATCNSLADPHFPRNRPIYC